MARISGIDIPKNKRGEISLTYIYGIGRSNAQKILTKAGVDWSKKVEDWTDDEQNAIRTISFKRRSFCYSRSIWLLKLDLFQ